MAITNVTCLRPGDYSLRRTGITADYEVVLADVKQLDSRREQEDIIFMPGKRCRKALDKAGEEIAVSEGRRKCLRVRHDREKVRFAEELAQRFDYSLSPGQTEKPVMNDRYAQLVEIHAGPLMRYFGREFYHTFWAAEVSSRVSTRRIPFAGKKHRGWSGIRLRRGLWLRSSIYLSTFRARTGNEL
jgi:hypothetical protein